MKNSSWRYLAFSIGAVLVASNAWWLFHTIDAGVTATYQEQSAQECEAQANQLEIIANHFVAGQSLAAVEPFLVGTTQASATFSKPDENLVIVGTLALELNQDNTVKALVRDPNKP